MCIYHSTDKFIASCTPADINYDFYGLLVNVDVSMASSFFFFFFSPLLFIVDWEGCKSFRGLIYFLPIDVSKLRNSEQCHEQFYGLMVRFGKSFFWFRELGILTSYLSSESAGSLKKKFFLHSPLELLLFWKRKKKCLGFLNKNLIYARVSFSLQCCLFLLTFSSIFFPKTTSKGLEALEQFGAGLAGRSQTNKWVQVPGNWGLDIHKWKNTKTFKMQR